ncbi:hypothetical protein ACFQS6_06105 [Xanthomonas populi]
MHEATKEGSSSASAQTSVRKRTGRFRGSATTHKPSRDSFFANYSEYAKTLRAWLVAYGIGAPVLFLTNNQLSAALKASPHRDWIVDLFLLGVALQVILAFVNKWCAWHLYVGEYDSEFQSRRSYKFWAWLNERSWIDLSIDALSLWPVNT